MHFSKKTPTQQLKAVCSKVYTFVLWRPPVITFQLWHTLVCTSRATCFHKISYYLKFSEVFVFGNSDDRTVYLCVFSNSCVSDAHESPSRPSAPSAPEPNTAETCITVGIPGSKGILGSTNPMATTILQLLRDLSQKAE